MSEGTTTETNSETGSRQILQIKNVHKTFKNDIMKKNRAALTNLTCNFEAGKCTALLGHNGAGKTTAIRIILGILFSDKGEVLFDGKSLDAAARGNIGYMPEINKLPLNLTAEEILRSHTKLYLRDKNKAEITELVEAKLKQVGLWEHRKKKIKHLSKGLGRRVAWSQASIHSPKLLILDEPFSGLDPLGRREMQSWIEMEKSRDASVILCTHELWSVNILCDEIHILNKGRLVYSSQDSDSVVSADTSGGYILHVSGTSQEILQEMASSMNLDMWQGLEQEGWSSKLIFDDYVNACEWFKACLEKGYLIIAFTSDGKATESYLLQFFEGGS